MTMVFEDINPVRRNGWFSGRNEGKGKKRRKDFDTPINPTKVNEKEKN